MSEELNDIALAEAYLNNELGAQERKAVEERQQNDPAFAQLLADLEVVFEGTREAFRGGIEAQLREMEEGLPEVEIDEAALILNDMEGEKKRGGEEERRKAVEKEEMPIRSLPVWLYRVAAVVVPLVLVLGWWMWPGESAEERLFAEYFEAPARVGAVVRGGGDEVAELRKRAGELYDAEKFAAAVPIYKELFGVHRDTQALFYLGVAQLGAKEMDKAIGSLEEFEKLSEDVRFEGIGYYVALAYLRKGEKEKALDLLKKEKGEQALELKEKLLQSIH